MASDPGQLLSILLGTTGQGYNGLRQVQADQQDQQLGAQKIQANQLALDGAAQRAQRDAEYQQDTASYFKDPTPQNLASLATKYPDHAKELKDSYQILQPAQLESRLNVLGGLFNSAKNGRADLVASNLDAVIKAEKAAGVDTSDAESAQQAVARGDPDALKSVQAFAQMHLAAADPKFATAIGAVDGDGKKFTNTPQGDIYDTSTGQVTHAAGPKPEVDTVKVFDENGNVVGSRRITHPPVGGITGEGIEQLALNAVPGATVTSGARSPEHNAEVGGKPNSYHLTDQARDLVPPSGMSMAAFHNVLQASLPGVKVLNEGDHIHIQPIARNTPSPTAFQSKPLGPVGASSLLDRSTISMMADQYLHGDKAVMQNLGRGKQGAENIVQLRKEITAQAKAKGLTGGDIAGIMGDFAGNMAAERAAGTRTANVELASTEAQRVLPLALQASQALPRNGFLPFGKAQQSIRNGNNDPKLRTFVAANNAAVNTYARAISPTGQPTVADKDHARDMLNTAYDQQSYAAVIAQMQKEIAAARAAPREVRSDLRAQISGRPAGGGGIPSDIAAILAKYRK